jgi:NAD(P)-dependent dehydrogenase (short-subunit alcohol dehydrogenase family)
MDRLEGRTALITGASRGIGRAIAESFAADGADIAINYTSNRDAAEEVASSVGSLGRKARVYQADVADESAVDIMVDQAIEDFGQIDILVNNAGLGSAAINRPHVADATNDQWSKLLNVNLWGPIYLCRKLVGHMRRASRSDVIMISSIAAQNMNRNGMRVNIIAPGLVDTDMGRRIVEATNKGASIASVSSGLPFGYVCTPQDIAATALHLCSESGRYITNQRITISGD